MPGTLSPLQSVRTARSMPRDGIGRVRQASDAWPSVGGRHSNRVGKFPLIAELVAGAAITGVTAVGVSAPASADPSEFNVLSCSCPQTRPEDGPAVIDQIKRGIQTALTDPQGISGRR